ncbi:MAG: ABC transporter permease [Candidatus Heimdallarchaeota archaeon]
MKIHSIIEITMKNLKIRLRQRQTYFFSFGFPLIFTFVFYFIFGTQEIISGFSLFTLLISGLLIYTASFGTINTAVVFCSEKQTGTLIRIDTTPCKRSNIFIGTLLSESFFLMIQLIIMFIVGYGILRLKWGYDISKGVFNQDLILLIIGFFIVFIFGLSTLGLGIIISAYAKTVEAGLGIAMVYVMPVLFLSGAMVPFENPIVYAFPPFWANQLYQQVVILGHNLLTDSLLTNSDNILNAVATRIPLWGALIIIIAFLAITLMIGILLFNKKTLS